MCAGAGLALLALGIVFATVAARNEWRRSDQLGVRFESSGQALVTAQLATATSGARLVEFGDHRVVLLRRLAATTAPQSLVVPASLAGGTVKFLLLVPGSALAVWSS